MTIITILIWGSFAFGNVPGLQLYVVQLAKKYTPHAVDTASGLNIAAFNVGIAFGSLTGGLWIGSLVVCCALALTYFSGLLDKKAKLKTQ